MMTSITIGKKILKIVIALAFWIGVWYVAAYFVGQELILPAPNLVFSELIHLGGTVDFWRSAGMSLFTIFLGFVSGVVLGTLLAVATSWSGIADLLLSPAVRVVRATPVASFIILALLWLGKAHVTGFISMLMVTPIVWGNVCSAIAETDKGLLEMAHMYGFGRLKTVRTVYIPSVTPSWSAACVTAIGLAWKSGVAAEVLCQPKASIGTNLYFSKIYLETPALFAWTAVVIILSFILEKGFVYVVRRMILRHKSRSEADDI